MPLKQPHLPAGRPAPAVPSDQVVLVDAQDRSIGTYPKLAAHQEGRLHRAVSVLVSDGDERILLQRRAITKYHSGGMWSNTCCTHPYPNESPAAAAHRRLQEEMGFDCDLERTGSILYRTELTGGLIEHEYDHVFLGEFEGEPQPDPVEVADWRWVGLTELLAQRDLMLQAYTPWFWLVLEHLREAGWPGPDLAPRDRTSQPASPSAG
ncbi:MAG: isopentenyl-diphosphate Delta-isomerase [Gemmatimonadota bacterium]|nr:MAG: isopentenyl-diphosphate Delta-isomerase [Gemmatimonadota bacterium]